MRPSTPPAVMTSSPFCSASIICFASFARFICGRIMWKYSSTNIRMIGRKPSMPPSAPPPMDCANAGEMITAGSETKRELYPPPALLQEQPRFFNKLLLFNCESELAHELLVVVQVMKRVQPRAEDLVGLLQVVEVGAAEVAAGDAAALLVERRDVVAVARIADA